MSDHLNPLPLWARHYIHELHTRADPQGTIKELYELKWQKKALTVLVGKLKARIRRLEKSRTR